MHWQADASAPLLLPPFEAFPIVRLFLGKITLLLAKTLWKADIAWHIGFYGIKKNICFLVYHYTQNDHRINFLTYSIRQLVTGSGLLWETGGILFREYCFGRENSLSSAPNSVKFREKFGEFALAQRSKAERNSRSSFESVLSETVFGPLPILARWDKSKRPPKA